MFIAVIMVVIMQGWEITNKNEECSLNEKSGDGVSSFVWGMGGPMWLFQLQGKDTFASFLNSWKIGVTIRTEDLAWKSHQKLGQVWDTLFSPSIFFS